MKQLLVGLVTLAMILVAMPAMAQHTPVEECGATPALPFTPIPTVSVTLFTGTPPSPVGDFFKVQPTAWPAAGGYDFCGILDTIFCSLGPLSSLAPEVGDFAFLVQCLNADINGPLDLEADIPVTANGIPDGQYELGLLAAVLNNTGHPLHNAALTAFQGNFVEIQALVMEALFNAELKSDEKDIRALALGLLPHLPGALASVLAGFCALGDATTNAAMDGLLGLLGDLGINPPEGGISSITTGVPQLGPLGDADGDGFSNRREYNWFKSVYPGDPAAVIAAQLDSSQTPPLDQPDVVVRGGGKYEVGSRVELKAVFINTDGEGATFQWYKQGVEIPDATGSSLLFLNTLQSDEGWYYVVATLPDKATELVSAITFITLVPVGSLPVAGGLGLALLAGGCALAGAVGIRRRK
ncbi:MAG: hypothetical protein GX580_17325 [Candidatus Hydrogenedens sp.]|nr:hypothetical protein [Candidatus Hydrogenedentota bacterium]NLF59390.1 hypothetical protein [Candidatus Hydrogenedens sp.]